MDGKEAPKTVRAYFTNNIDVLVGPEMWQFPVCQDIICHRSKFFQAACSERWNAGHRAVELLEESADIFDLYLYCVYKDQTNVGDLSVLLQGEENIPRRADRAYRRLLLTYMLADKLRDIVSANLIADGMIKFHQKSNALPAVPTLNLALESFPEHSPVNLLFLHFYVYEATASQMEKLCKHESASKQFLGRVLMGKTNTEMGEDRSDRLGNFFQAGFIRKDTCRYQQHDKEHSDCGDECLWLSED